MRAFAAILIAVSATLSLRAGDDGVAGNWKVFLVEDGQPANLWLLRVENKAGKLTGEIEGLKGSPDTTLRDLKVTGDLLQFDLRLEVRSGQIIFRFEGKTPRAGAKKILGSIKAGNTIIPAYLEATTAKNKFELNREVVTRTPNDPRVFSVVMDLIKEAKENKVPAKDVEEWLDLAARSAEAYGPRFQAEFGMQLFEIVLTQKDYLPLAERLVPKNSPLGQISFLAAKGASLKDTGTPAEAKALEGQIEALEEPAFAEYAKKALDFTPAKFKGRKSKSDRAVLVELFTGAMCPPCVAADLGFDALEKSFPTSDVVLLQYHLHVPGPDALSNADTVKRGDFYDRTLRGTPMIYINGKPDKNVQGGGGREDAEDKFKEYREALEPILEKPAEARIQARAVRKGDKIAIQASVKDVAKPGESTRLRLALVEDWVRYKARNGMLYHHRVVRAMPGGPAGVAVTKKELEHEVTVDLKDLRSGLNKYLDDFNKKAIAEMESPFPDAQRPMRFRNLHVVAFVQQDDSLEVLQALDVPVTEE